MVRGHCITGPEPDQIRTFSAFEPPRDCRRFQSLRGLGHGQAYTVLPKNTRTLLPALSIPVGFARGHRSRRIAVLAAEVEFVRVAPGRRGHSLIRLKEPGSYLQSPEATNAPQVNGCVERPARRRVSSIVLLASCTAVLTGSPASRPW